MQPLYLFISDAVDAVFLINLLQCTNISKYNRVSYGLFDDRITSISYCPLVVVFFSFKDLRTGFTSLFRGNPVF